MFPTQPLDITAVDESVCVIKPNIFSREFIQDTQRYRERFEKVMLPRLKTASSSIESNLEEVVDGLYIKSDWKHIFDDIDEIHIITAGGGGNVLGGIFLAQEIRLILKKIGYKNIELCVFTNNLRRGEENPLGGPTPLENMGIFRKMDKGKLKRMKNLGKSKYFYLLNSKNTAVQVIIENRYVVRIPIKEEPIIKPLKQRGISLIMMDVSVGSNELAEDYYNNVINNKRVLTIGLDMGGDILARYPEPITQQNKNSHPERNIKSPVTDAIVLGMLAQLRRYENSKVILAISALGGDGELIERGEYLEDFIEGGELIGVLDNRKLLTSYGRRGLNLLEGVLNLKIDSEVSNNFLKRLKRSIEGVKYEFEVSERPEIVIGWKNYKSNFDKTNLKELASKLAPPLSGQKIRNNTRTEIFVQAYLYMIFINPLDVERRINEKVRKRIQEVDSWQDMEMYFSQKLKYTTEMTDENNEEARKNIKLFYKKLSKNIELIKQFSISEYINKIINYFKGEESRQLISSYFRKLKEAFLEMRYEYNYYIFNQLIVFIFEKITEKSNGDIWEFISYCEILKSFIKRIYDKEREIPETLLVICTLLLRKELIPIIKITHTPGELNYLLKILETKILEKDRLRHFPLYQQENMQKIIKGVINSGKILKREFSSSSLEKVDFIKNISIGKFTKGFIEEFGYKLTFEGLRKSLEKIGIIKENEQIISYQEISSWERGGSEIYIAVAKVIIENIRGKKEERKFIAKAIVKMFPEIVEKVWLKRIEILKKIGIKTPHLYSIHNCVFYQEYVPYNAKEIIDKAYGEKRKDIISKLAYIAARLDISGFRPLDFIRDLRSDGKEFYYCDVGEDLGSPTDKFSDTAKNQMFKLFANKEGDYDFALKEYQKYIKELSRIGVSSPVQREDYLKGIISIPSGRAKDELKKSWERIKYQSVSYSFNDPQDEAQLTLIKEDFKKIIKKKIKEDSKEVVIYVIGLGSALIGLEELELVQLIQAFKEIFTQLVDKRSRKEWKIQFLGIDTNESHLEESEDFIKKNVNESFIVVDLILADVLDVSKLSQIGKDKKGDYIFARYLTYANILAVEGKLSIENLNKELGDILMVYFTLRSIISTLAKEGTCYIIEPVGKIKEDAPVFLFPGAQVLSLSYYSKDSSLKLYLSEKGTGMYRIKNPEGILNLRLEDILNTSSIGRNWISQEKKYLSGINFDIDRKDLKTSSSLKKVNYSRITHQTASTDSTDKNRNKPDTYPFVRSSAYQYSQWLSVEIKTTHQRYELGIRKNLPKYSQDILDGRLNKLLNLIKGYKQTAPPQGICDNILTQSTSSSIFASLPLTIQTDKEKLIIIHQGLKKQQASQSTIEGILEEISSSSPLYSKFANMDLGKFKGLYKEVVGRELDNRQQEKIERMLKRLNEEKKKWKGYKPPAGWLRPGYPCICEYTTSEVKKILQNEFDFPAVLIEVSDYICKKGGSIYPFNEYIRKRYLISRGEFTPIHQFVISNIFGMPAIVSIAEDLFVYEEGGYKDLGVFIMPIDYLDKKAWPFVGSKVTPLKKEEISELLDILEHDYRRVELILGKSYRLFPDGTFIPATEDGKPDLSRAPPAEEEKLGFVKDGTLYPQKLKQLIRESNHLIEIMFSAYEKGNLNALNEAFNKAKVRELEGENSDKPHLFVIATREPEEIDITKLSNEEIRKLINRYKPLDLTDKEIDHLRKRKPFKFTTPQESQRVGEIFRASLAQGLLGIHYIVTNIKRFSDNSHLAYISFLKRIVSEYNGYLVILLSIEESPQVLKGDGCGMATAIQAVDKVLGREFLKENNINIITDGGLKTRGGNWTGLYGYNGCMPTPYGVPYYKRAIDTLGKLRLSHKEFGKGRVYWTASDGDYLISNLNYAGIPEQDLDDKDNWSMIIHGQEEEVFSPSLMDDVFKKLTFAYNKYEHIKDKKELERKLEEELIKDELIAPIIKHIHKKKLPQLGENLSHPEKGILALFYEEPSPIKILTIIKEHNTNKIISNAFLIVYKKESFLKQIDTYYKLINGKRLGSYGGSYFKAVIEAQFNPSALESFPEEIRESLKALHKVFSKDTIIAAGLGKYGKFTDRGKTDLLSGAYIEYIEEKRKDEEGLILKGNIHINSYVRVILKKGATAILENVNLIATKPVKLIISGNVFIQNTTLKLTQDTTILENTIIIDSFIERLLQINGANTVILGVEAKKELLDITQKGTFKPINVLEIYPDETIVSIDTTQGFSYINRTFTYLPYKGENIIDLIDYEQAIKTNPRLIGIEGITDKETLNKILGYKDKKSIKLDLIKVKSWLNNQKKPCDIQEAKKDMDYVKAFKRLGLASSSISLSELIRKKNTQTTSSALSLQKMELIRKEYPQINKGLVSLKSTSSPQNITSISTFEKKCKETLYSPDKPYYKKVRVIYMWIDIILAYYDLPLGKAILEDIVEIFKEKTDKFNELKLQIIHRLGIEVSEDNEFAAKLLVEIMKAVLEKEDKDFKREALWTIISTGKIEESWLPLNILVEIVKLSQLEKDLREGLIKVIENSVDAIIYGIERDIEFLKTYTPYPSSNRKLKYDNENINNFAKEILQLPYIDKGLKKKVNKMLRLKDVYIEQETKTRLTVYKEISKSIEEVISRYKSYDELGWVLFVYHLIKLAFGEGLAPDILRKVGFFKKFQGDECMKAIMVWACDYLQKIECNRRSKERYLKDEWDRAPYRLRCEGYKLPYTVREKDKEDMYDLIRLSEKINSKEKEQRIKAIVLLGACPYKYSQKALEILMERLHIEEPTDLEVFLPLLNSILALIRRGVFPDLKDVNELIEGLKSEYPSVSLHCFKVAFSLYLFSSSPIQKFITSLAVMKQKGRLENGVGSQDLKEDRESFSSSINTKAQGLSCSSSSIDISSIKQIASLMRNKELKEDIWYKIATDEGRSRLGFVLDIIESELRSFLEEKVDYLRNKKAFVFVGMGGSINTIKIMRKITDKKIIFLDTPDKEMIEEVIRDLQKKGISLKELEIIAISKSATTFETHAIVNILNEIYSQAKEDITQNLLWLIDLENEGKLKDKLKENGWEEERIAKLNITFIQIDKATDIGGRFTSPKTALFILPLFIHLDLDIERTIKVLRYIQQLEKDRAFEDRINEYVNLVIREKEVYPQVAIILPEKFKDFFEEITIWLTQLYQESLGGKVDGFDPKILVFLENQLEEKVENLLNRHRIIKLDYTFLDESNLIKNLIYLFLSLEYIVLGIAYKYSLKYEPLNFVNQPNVEVYKKKMKEIEELGLPQKIKLVSLESLIKTHLKENHKFIEIVYYGTNEEIYRKLNANRIIEDRFVLVFKGPDWNHHSFQAAYKAGHTLFLLLVDENTDKNVKLIAYATYQSLSDNKVDVIYKGVSSSSLKVKIDNEKIIITKEDLQEITFLKEYDIIREERPQINKALEDLSSSSPIDKKEKESANHLVFIYKSLSYSGYNRLIKEGRFKPVPPEAYLERMKHFRFVWEDDYVIHRGRLSFSGRLECAIWFKVYQGRRVLIRIMLPASIFLKEEVLLLTKDAKYYLDDLAGKYQKDIREALRDRNSSVSKELINMVDENSFKNKQYLDSLLSKKVFEKIDEFINSLEEIIIPADLINEYLKKIEEVILHYDSLEYREGMIAGYRKLRLSRLNLFSTSSTISAPGVGKGRLLKNLKITSSPIHSEEIVKQFLVKIRRSYDFRSKNADEELTEEVIEVWAKGLVKFQRGLLDKDKLVCVIGYDIRHSSERISAKLIDTLLNLGIDVIDIGLVTTPILYFATLYFDADLGIMITASHNPPHENGFKPVIKDKDSQRNPTTPEIRQITEFAKEILDTQEFVGFGREASLIKADNKEIIEKYVNMVIASNWAIGPKRWLKLQKEKPYKDLADEADEFIKERLKKEGLPLKGLKVVIDPGNGVAGLPAKMVLEKLGAQVYGINMRPDGSFPNHLPDPTVTKYMNQAYQKLKEAKADIAIGYDNDGDRIGAVAEINDKRFDFQGEHILGAFIDRILKEFPGAKIVVDVKMSDCIIEKVKELGGIPITFKTGHTNIKQKMRETGAVFGAEQSAHMYPAWFGKNGFFDDSIQASLLLLLALKEVNGGAQRLLNKLPEWQFSPDIRPPYSEKLLSEYKEDLRRGD